MAEIENLEFLFKKNIAQIVLKNNIFYYKEKKKNKMNVTDYYKKIFPRLK